MDRDVEALLDQVDQPIAQDQIDRDVGMAGEIFRQDRHQVQPSERRRRADAQQPRRTAHEPLHGELAGLHFCRDPCTMGVGGVPRLGEAELARGAVEQARAEGLLKAGDMLAGGRARNTEPARGQ